MKAGRRKALNAMDEHHALHEIEKQCCAVMNAVLTIFQLHALRGVITTEDCDAISEAAKRVMDKATAAHAKYEQLH